VHDVGVFPPGDNLTKDTLHHETMTHASIDDLPSGCRRATPDSGVASTLRSIG
jgi:hypothetical protein